MARRRNTRRTPTEVVAFTYPDESRRNIPTAEMEPVLDDEQRSPVRLAYERRNRDLDPQLVWRGKDEQDADGLLHVAAPPLFAQEKVHPKVLVDDLVRLSRKGETAEQPQLDLFADFNGLHDPDARTEFYQHDGYWQNRMILGDSLQVMASLSEREGLRGKVQCIYIDPPYGIRFNSNFQWSTTSRDVRDGNVAHITREPEQVKAFRDTWREGIHSYLTYLRDRLTVARDLLADSGSIFVQIGDENVHRVRNILDDVFDNRNFVSQIWFRKKTMPLGATLLEQMGDWILFYAKDKDNLKYRKLFLQTSVEGDNHWNIAVFPDSTTSKLKRTEVDSHNLVGEPFDPAQLISMSPIGYSPNRDFPVLLEGKTFAPPRGKSWKTDREGISRLQKARRLVYYEDGERLRYLLRLSDYPTSPLSTVWGDTSAPNDMRYVVETSLRPIQRCILMTTDPGDLVLDPTCGSGTTAYVAEQWGRRWITIDTSRVALALARARIMGARYPYYLLADSKDGQIKESELSRRAPSDMPTYGNVRQGFVYERVPHITLRDIANNAEIDVIYDEVQAKMEPLREKLNRALNRKWEEWEIPREASDPWTGIAAESWQLLQHTDDAEDILKLLSNINGALKREYRSKAEVPSQPREPWDSAATELHKEWWKLRIARQKEIDASIAASADCEYLYDKPYEDRHKVRVAGPFTVESLSPHRVMVADDGQRPQGTGESGDSYRFDGEVPERDFAGMILDNLRTSGVQQAQKSDKIDFTSLNGWPGRYVCAEGRFTEGSDEYGNDADNAVERRAAIFIGPEFGTVVRADLTAAAREAAEAGFDLLIACAFSYEAHATELTRIGALPVLKARMNADLHMADTLKNDSRGNLFVIFGEPDIELQEADDDMVRIKIRGVDIFNPATGQVRSDDTDGIACWFVDTDYNEESFFVRQAYFLGASDDPYKALKTTLKAEIDADAWATLNSDMSRPFPKPQSGRIAVKVINHLGDEAMKVLTVR